MTNARPEQPPLSDDLKRLRMRAWRRGIREMDLILGPFADDRLPGMAPETVALFDILLEKNDHDLYRWISTGAAGPDDLAALLAEIGAHARARLIPQG
jgi:antitoxin CptB